jgi:hypothetical protein
MQGYAQMIRTRELFFIFNLSWSSHVVEAHATKRASYSMQFTEYAVACSRVFHQ